MRVQAEPQQLFRQDSLLICSEAGRDFLKGSVDFSAVCVSASASLQLTCLCLDSASAKVPSVPRVNQAQTEGAVLCNPQ